MVRRSREVRSRSQANIAVPSLVAYRRSDPSGPGTLPHPCGGHAVLVDGPVQVSPLAADLDVGLVDANRPGMRLAEGSQATLDQRRIGQNPAVQSVNRHGTGTPPEAGLSS